MRPRGPLSSPKSASYVPCPAFAGSAPADPERGGKSRAGGARGSWRAADGAQFWGRGAGDLSL